MPSFLELLESSMDPDERSSGSVPLDVLTSVRTEGGRRRRRRQRRNLALGGLVLLVVAVPVLGDAFGGDDAPQEVRVADGPTAAEAVGDAEATTTSTTGATEVLGEVIERPADVTTGAPDSVAPTAPATQACVNSTDPICGEFRWEPDPANGPLSLSTAEVIALAPGRSTTIYVNWADPDATLAFEYFASDGTLLAGGCTSTPRYGPWSPPPPSGGSGTLSYRYTAPDTPGDYTVAVSAAAGDCDGPYRSEAQVLISVHVE